MTIIGSFPNSDKNNLVPALNTASGLTVEPLGDTWTRVDFTFHAGDEDLPDVDVTDGLYVAAGLYPRAGSLPPYAFAVKTDFTVNTTTNILTGTGGQYVDGHEVMVSNVGGGLPAPLVQGTRYYVRDRTGVTCKLALTPGGTAIDITTAGTGTHYISNVILSVEWERNPLDPVTFEYTGLHGTVTEIWRSYGIEAPQGRTFGGRVNVDIGYVRAGPRYSVLISGAECRGYIDYVSAGGIPPRAKVSAGPYGFPYPLRLGMHISETTDPVTTANIRDVQLAGKLGQKTILSHDNKEAWGVDSDHLHLRIYQVGAVNGFPVDIDL